VYRNAQDAKRRIRTGMDLSSFAFYAMLKFMTKIILVDGMSIVFRSFYAINMWNSKNLHIGAIYGFLKQIVKLIDIYKSPYIVIGFDMKQETWRHRIHSEYKSNRRSTPPELIPQFEMVRNVCAILGLKVYEGDGYEADDWIASCAHTYSNNARVYIVSTDKDFLQLVSSQVVVFNPFNGIEIDQAGVVQKWGVTSEQVVDFLSLTGDEVDAVPGVYGIGPKTAARWLNEYGNIENIISNSPNLTPISKRNHLSQGIENLYKAKMLITLYKTLEVDTIDAIRMRPSMQDASNFLRAHEIDLGGRLEYALRSI